MDLVSALRVLAPPVILAAVTGVAVAAMATVGAPPPTSGVAVTVQGGALVTGPEAGMVPGTAGPLTVHLTNTGGSTVSVTAIGALAGDPVDDLGRPIVHCLPVVAIVSPLPEPVTVPAGATVSAELTVRLSATVQRACRDLSFPLGFSVTGATGVEPVTAPSAAKLAG